MAAVAVTTCIFKCCRKALPDVASISPWGCQCHYHFLSMVLTIQTPIGVNSAYTFKMWVITSDCCEENGTRVPGKRGCYKHPTWQSL